MKPTIRTQGSHDSEPAIVEDQVLEERACFVHDSIARRAFEIFQARGEVAGTELDDWLAAETELLRPVPIEIAEYGSFIKVRAEVPGIRPEDLDIAVEPERVLFSGRIDHTFEDLTEETVYTERIYKEIHRLVTLPSEVDPAKADATLRDGVAVVTLRKTAAADAASAARSVQ
ncbi:MAG TPA: Hsp20/alpha crystallin family protein [Blastocatellia bacterium]|nr:Hsp20/alpha crystallin family protein [Blastocatellia bacterium]